MPLLHGLSVSQSVCLSVWLHLNLSFVLSSSLHLYLTLCVSLTVYISIISSTTSLSGYWYTNRPTHTHTHTHTHRLTLCVVGRGLVTPHITDTLCRVCFRQQFTLITFFTGHVSCVSDLGMYWCQAVDGVRWWWWQDWRQQYITCNSSNQYLLTYETTFSKYE